MFKTTYFLLEKSVRIAKTGVFNEEYQKNSLKPSTFNQMSFFHGLERTRARA